MSQTPFSATYVVVEDEVTFSLTQLCQASGAEAEQVIVLVQEGVLTPRGSGPQDWQFQGPSLPRTRQALRLASDFEIGLPGAALVMDLLDEIKALRARLRRGGIG